MDNSIKQTEEKIVKAVETMEAKIVKAEKSILHNKWVRSAGAIALYGLQRDILLGVQAVRQRAQELVQRPCPRAGRGRESRSGHRLGWRRRPLLLHRRARRGSAGRAGAAL